MVNGLKVRNDDGHVIIYRLKFNRATKGDDVDSRLLKAHITNCSQTRCRILVKKQCHGLFVSFVCLSHLQPIDNILEVSLLVSTKRRRSLLVVSLIRLVCDHLIVSVPIFTIFEIGSYTFAKTLEYKAKHGLNSGKEITVMPPAEYEERFINALEGYFLACPGL